MRYVFISTLIATFALLSGASYAQSRATISVTGEITGQTCTISVNGVNAANSTTITLLDVKASKLSHAGQTSGRTDFSVSLSNCIGGAKSAIAFFEGGTTVDLSNGNLKNIRAGNDIAKNVQLQLLDATSNNVIKVGSEVQRTKTTRVTLTNGTAKLPYAVQYYATGKATGGLVTSSVAYSIEYF